MKKMNVEKKNRVKVVRTIAQVVLIAALVFLPLRGVLFPRSYQPLATLPAGQAEGGASPGFLALSYLGVEGTDSQARVVIPRAKLEKHLAALKASGYVTITLRDIAAYYNEGRALPEKSVFLMFEDGLKDTPALVHGLLEDYNFHASIWAYGSNLQEAGQQYLSGNDLKSLENSSYWDIGASGYRLSFINVFDRYGNFVGQLNSDAYANAMNYLDRKYNHYLMDFIRDGDEVPLENNIQMGERIAQDYSLMDSAFSQGLGHLPTGYSLMHANTGKFGSHDLVSAENEKWIKEKFLLNFNREGYALNNRDSSPYDLTRMQPYGYWPVNHLLMRLADETGQDFVFITGDARQEQHFSLLEGAVEYAGNTLNLTTSPSTRGLLLLKDEVPGGLEVSTRLMGNTYGSQLIFFGSDADRQNAVGVGLIDNQLVVGTRKGGAVTELLRFNLADLETAPRLLSIEEDKKEVEMGIAQAIIRFIPESQRVEDARQRLSQASARRPATVAEGAQPYKAPIDQLLRGDKALKIQWTGTSLDVFVNGQHLVKALAVPAQGGNRVLLESRLIPPEENQRNIYDPIYDGVFRDLEIRSFGGGQDRVYFSNSHTWLERILNTLTTTWEDVNNWFIRNM